MVLKNEKFNFWDPFVLPSILVILCDWLFDHLSAIFLDAC